MNEINTPLFQLNLLLHMTLPHPRISGINPYFYNNGYTIKYIEKGISLPPLTVSEFKKIDINKKMVTPEAILVNKNKILLLECKVSDFQLDWNHHATKQAAGYLSLTPSYLKEYFGFDLQEECSGEILYGIPNEYKETVNTTLDVLCSRLKEIFTEILPHNTFTISIETGGIFVDFNNTEGAIKILDSSIISSNNKPIFYLIPFDINGRIDHSDEELLHAQLKNALRSTIGRSLQVSFNEINLEDIYKSITPVWDITPKPFKDKLKLWVKSNIKQWIRSLPPGLLKLESSKIEILNISTKNKHILIKNLISDKFLETKSSIKIDSLQLEFDLDDTYISHP